MKQHIYHTYKLTFKNISYYICYLVNSLKKLCYVQTTEATLSMVTSICKVSYWY
jgi:hypothetical protein